MEKTFLKPIANEIVIKGNNKEGNTDVFIYDYYDENDEEKRKLGGLYIIGNVKQEKTENYETEDDLETDYITNLIASIAKREYYSNPNLSPHNAFVATLKKINDVVEEFFKNESLKINMGIFAIAGEKIMISKVGKFKILLSRKISEQNTEKRIIDILNNIDLFSKEQTEEKRFSNIISGKIELGDKLFAFYPNRSLTAREKILKTELLKTKTEEFLEKIHSIKQARTDFDCAAIYISLVEHKVSITNQTKEITPLNPVTSPENSLNVNLAKFGTEKENQSNNLIGKENEQNISSNFLPNSKSLKQEQEIPEIRYSEFSLGKKTNPILLSIITPLKALKRLYTFNTSFKNKIIILSLGFGIIITGVVLIKKFIIIDPEQRQLNIVINQALNNLKIAKTKITQKDLISARQLLAESLASIQSKNSNNDKIKKTTEAIYEILDNIDKIVDLNPTLLETLPEELTNKINILNNYKNQGISLDIYEENLYILTNNNILKIDNINDKKTKEPVVWLKSGTIPEQAIALAVDGKIYVINSTGTIYVYYKGEKISEINTFIFSKPGDLILTNKNSDKFYIVNKSLARIYEFDKQSSNLIRTIKIGSSEPFIDAYLYKNNEIIVITKDERFWKIEI
jgi:hypothetical protein